MYINKKISKPDMSGEDICKEIRKFSKVPIIMLKAKVDESSILNGLKKAANKAALKFIYHSYIQNSNQRLQAYVR
jgi:DNA-binding response OmpR family regulator